jgi:tRNA threonylcarbamoyladenosine biosynthesis protein TsaB
VAGPLTLAVDASTYVGTVAVLRGAEVLAEGEARMRGEREERLMPAVAGALAAAGVGVGELHQVVCGAGPGSFTSLRIAASIAKGVAAGRGCELRAVGSLLLLGGGTGAGAPARPGRYLAAVDAMRGEHFAVELEITVGGWIEQRSPVALIPTAELVGEAERRGLTLLGPGQQVDARPHARGAARIADAPLVDLATWEPAYGRLAEAQVKWEAAHGRALPKV